MLVDKFGWLASEPPEIREKIARHLDQIERNEFNFHWHLWARPAQLPPLGDWRIWMIMAGRGFGKNRRIDTGVANCRNPTPRLAQF